MSALRPGLGQGILDLLARQKQQQARRERIALLMAERLGAASVAPTLVQGAIRAVAKHLRVEIARGLDNAFATSEWTADHSFGPGETLGDYIVLGAGCFSVALIHRSEPQKVIKISLTGYDAGPEYWRWVMDNPEVESTPKMYSVGYDVEHGWRYCVMKRYLPSDTLGGEERLARSQQLRGSTIMEWAATIGRVDLHGGNWMVDPDTHASVIIDPVSMTDENMNATWG